MAPRGFDAAKLTAHRIEQARAGWSLLRGCPNTAAIDRLGFLDALSLADAVSLARQLSDEVPGPLAAAYVHHHQEDRPKSIGRIPVKILAGVQQDAAVGGIAGWAKMMGMTEGQMLPPAPHASTFDDLVPVRPPRLRKLVTSMCAGLLGASETKVSSEMSRYAGSLGPARVTVLVTYPASGGRFSGRQMDYRLQVQKPEFEGPTQPLAYEDCLRLPSNWDFITEQNAERSVQHLAELIRTCVDLT